MLFVLRPGNCDVVWEFGCEELVLQCVLEVRGGYGFYLWVFGSEWKEVLLFLVKMWWVFCGGIVLVSIRGCEGCVVIGVV